MMSYADAIKNKCHSEGTTILGCPCGFLRQSQLLMTMNSVQYRIKVLYSELVKLGGQGGHSSVSNQA
jgi:hypothetical protein